MNHTEKIHFNNIRGDITGGITAAIVALPFALAIGLASGAGAEAGLYDAIITGFFAAVLQFKALNKLHISMSPTKNL